MLSDVMLTVVKLNVTVAFVSVQTLACSIKYDDHEWRLYYKCPLGV